MPGYSTPRSAVAFGVIVLVLIGAYIAVAFLYGNGWATLAMGALAAVMLLLTLCVLYAVSVRWARGGAPP